MPADRSGRGRSHGARPCSPWSVVAAAPRPRRLRPIFSGEAPDSITACVDTTLAAGQPAIDVPLSRPVVRLLSVQPFPPVPVRHWFAHRFWSPCSPDRRRPARRRGRSREPTCRSSRDVHHRAEWFRGQTSCGSNRPAADRAAGGRRRTRPLPGFALFGTAAIEGQAQRSLGSSRNALHLSAPTIGLDLVVVNGDRGGDLSRGPGLLPASGRPDSERPIVIVGSRTTNGAPFRHLAASSCVGRRPQPANRDEHGIVRGGAGNDGAGPRPVHRSRRSAAPLPHHGQSPIPGRRPARRRRHGDFAHRRRRIRTGGNRRSTGARGIVDRVLLALNMLGLIAWGWSVRSHFRPVLPRWALLASWLPAIIGSYLFWRFLLESFSLALTRSRRRDVTARSSCSPGSSGSSTRRPKTSCSPTRTRDVGCRYEKDRPTLARAS